jgi:hypothetical protein
MDVDSPGRRRSATAGPAPSASDGAAPQSQGAHAAGAASAGHSDHPPQHLQQQQQQALQAQAQQEAERLLAEALQACIALGILPEVGWARGAASVGRGPPRGCPGCPAAPYSLRLCRRPARRACAP